MFEKLFTFRSAVQMHRAAPLAREREEFLSYLHRRGVCRGSLRSFAALLNQIVRFLQLKKLRDVRELEIENAAQKWFKCRRAMRGRTVGPYSEPHFKWLAKRWLRFHGRFIPSPPPRQPFAREQREYNEFMKSERRLSQSTIEGRMWQMAKFLRWCYGRRKSLRTISLK